MTDTVRVKIGDNPTVLQVVTLVGAGVALGAMPHILGLALGLAAFLATPILGAAAAIAIGVLIRRIAPSSPRLGLILAAAATGGAFVGGLMLTLALLAIHNGGSGQSMILWQALALFAGAASITGAFMAIGLWLSRSKTR